KKGDNWTYISVALRWFSKRNNRQKMNPNGMMRAGIQTLMI
ncbi:unnamed protein product, partial [marine sediment metagenome]